jgi:hypothetical protein
MGSNVNLELLWACKRRGDNDEKQRTCVSNLTQRVDSVRTNRGPELARYLHIAFYLHIFQNIISLFRKRQYVTPCLTIWKRVR